MKPKLTYKPDTVAKWLLARGFARTSISGESSHVPPVKWHHFENRDFTIGVQQEAHEAYPAFWVIYRGKRSDDPEKNPYRVRTFGELKRLLVTILLEN